MTINKLQLNIDLTNFIVNQEQKMNYFEKYSSRIIHSYIYTSIYTFTTELKNNTQQLLANVQKNDNNLYIELLNNQNFITDFEDKKTTFNFSYFLQTRNSFQKNDQENIQNQNIDKSFNSLSIFITSSSSTLLKILKYVVEKEIQFNIENNLQIEGTFNLKNETIFYSMKLLSIFDKTLNFQLKNNNFELKVRNFNFFFDNKTEKKESFYYNEKSIIGIKNYLIENIGIKEEQIIFDKNGFFKKVNSLQKKEYKTKTKTIIFNDKLINFIVIDFNCVLQNLTSEQQEKLEYWINEGFGNKNSFGFGNVDLSSYINMAKFNYKESNLNRIDQRKNRIKTLLEA